VSCKTVLGLGGVLLLACGAFLYWQTISLAVALAGIAPSAIKSLQPRAGISLAFCGAGAVLILFALLAALLGRAEEH
jgi:hypothetical protein